jgi:hypothetical protein
MRGRIKGPRRVTRVVRVNENPAAAAVGCPAAWKDMFAVLPERLRSAPAARMWSVPVTSVLAALDSAPPAAACTMRHTAFAALTADDDGGWAMVELDGCHRLLRTNNTLGQLDGTTIDLLTTPR